MGDGSEDVEDQFTGCGCGIDLFFKADQADILLFQVFDGFKEFFEGSTEPVQPDDSQTVTGAGVIYQGRQAGTIELFARNNILKHSDITRCPINY